MNKYDKAIILLEKEISLIKNKDDYLLSKDAYLGHKLRYREELELISRNLKSGKILDIGASPYHISFCLKKLGYDVWSIDVNPKILKGFQERNKLKVRKSNIEIEKLPFRDEEFDMVVFTEIFEHLAVNPIAALREINRVLKPGGIILLSTPNLYSLHKIIMFMFGKSFNDALTEFKKIESTGYMGHIREYSNSEIKNILKYCNFKIESTYFKKYNSYFLIPVVKKTPLVVLGLALELVTNIIRFLRPTQIVIGKKI